MSPLSEKSGLLSIEDADNSSRFYRLFTYRGMDFKNSQNLGMLIALAVSVSVKNKTALSK